VFAGALLVALLSVAVEFGLAGVQHVLVSRGLRVGKERVERDIDQAPAEAVPAARAPIGEARQG
jgi:hypothetical protein